MIASTESRVSAVHVIRDYFTSCEVRCPILTLTSRPSDIVDFPIDTLFVSWPTYEQYAVNKLNGAKPLSSMKLCSTTPTVFNRAFKTSSSDKYVRRETRTQSIHTVRGNIF